MAQPTAIKAFVTYEGREIIIDAMDRSLYHPGNEEQYNLFQLKTARLAFNGTDADDVINMTSQEFQDRWDANGVTNTVDFSPYGVGNSEGFFNITHYKLPADPYNKIEFYVCLCPGENLEIPAPGINSLMIYADPDPTVPIGPFQRPPSYVYGQEKSFIYAIFPPITKLESDGLQFRVTLEL